MNFFVFCFQLIDWFFFFLVLVLSREKNLTEKQNILVLVRHLIFPSHFFASVCFPRFFSMISFEQTHVVSLIFGQRTASTCFCFLSAVDVWWSIFHLRSLTWELPEWRESIRRRWTTCDVVASHKLTWTSSADRFV